MLHYHSITASTKTIVTARLQAGAK